MNKIVYYFFIMIVVLIVACQPEEVEVAQYDGTLYNFVFPENFGDPELPKNNILTKEGVRLGKMLFYEKALSKDGTQAWCKLSYPNRWFF